MVHPTNRVTPLYHWIGLIWIICWASTPSATAKINTNAAVFINPPAWLKLHQVQHVIDKIERKLEWSTRRIKVVWYNDAKIFQAQHGFKGDILAIARRKDHSIHMGPKVTKENFAHVFGHELAHVIVFQKYKARIPGWLEEGLANYAASYYQVDFGWLAKHPNVSITKLTHPFSVAAQVESKFHYMASLAAMLFLESKCSIRELLNLSLASKLENFLQSYCQIKSFDREFWLWIKKNEASGKSSKRKNLGVDLQGLSH